MSCSSIERGNTTSYTVRYLNQITYLVFDSDKFSIIKVMNEVWKICVDYSLTLDSGKDGDMVVRGLSKYGKDGLENFTNRLHNIKGIYNASTVTDYDDNRVYQTGERARDSRLDCCTMRG